MTVRHVGHTDTNSQGHTPSVSGEDFKGVLSFMGVVAILVM